MQEYQAMQTTSDLFVAWGVEAGRELCYVEAAGVGREYVIDNDTDFQIDLFDDGLSALQIREVMADVRMNRLRAAECPCCGGDDFSHEYGDYPRAECARPEERPPGSARSSQGCGRGFLLDPVAFIAASLAVAILGGFWLLVAALVRWAWA